MYPPTALKRQAPSSFIFLMTNPFFSWSAFSNQCSCCNRGRISEETQWEFIIMCSVNRQTSNEKVIVGNIYFAHLKLSRASQRSSYFMHQQDQNSYRLYNDYIRLNNTILSIFFNHCTWFINNDQCVGKDIFEYEKQGLRFSKDRRNNHTNGLYGLLRLMMHFVKLSPVQSVVLNPEDN